MYTSVGVSLHGGAAGATYAVADGLNPPQFVDVFAADGSLRWSFGPGAGTYLVDSARHVESAPAGAVDTFAALVTGAGTTLFGLTSAATTSYVVWNTTLPDCATDGGGGTYNGLQASDDGSALAFLCHGATAQAVLLDGQTGDVKWRYDLGDGVQVGQGSIQIAGAGAFVLFVNEQGKPTPNTAEAFVIDAASGMLRDNITIPFFITAAISDSGDYVVVGDDSNAHVWLFDAASAHYKPAYDLTPPAGPRGWIPWDIVMSTGSDAQEMIVLGCIAGDVLSVQVTAYALVGGAQLTNWVSPVNTKLQENPTMRADGGYIGVALWGDSGEAGYPTVVLLQAGQPAPLFNFTSPGSMFAVDIAVDSSSATQDVVLLSAAGKAVPCVVVWRDDARGNSLLPLSPLAHTRPLPPPTTTAGPTPSAMAAMRTRGASSCPSRLR